MRRLILLGLLWLAMVSVAAAQSAEVVWVEPTTDAPRWRGVRLTGAAPADSVWRELLVGVPEHGARADRFSRADSLVALLDRLTGTNLFTGGVWSVRPDSGRLSLGLTAEEAAALTGPPDSSDALPYRRWSWLLAAERADFLVRRDSAFRMLVRSLRGSRYTARLTSDLRDPAQQRLAVSRGHSLAPLSHHEIGLAADISIFRRRRVVGHNIGLYQMLGGAARSVGLTWGGDFVGFYDGGHVQQFVNGGPLLDLYPELSVEFEPYRVRYNDRIATKLAAGRGAEIQDTKALVDAMNRIDSSRIALRPFAPSADSAAQARWVALAVHRAGAVSRAVLAKGDTATMILMPDRETRSLYLIRQGRVARIYGGRVKRQPTGPRLHPAAAR